MHRYQLRVWGSGQRFRDDRRDVDNAVSQLLEILTRATGPILAELSGDEQLVARARAQARRIRLLVVASQLNQMRQAVKIAGINMSTADTADGGLLDDDRRLHDWFAAQLADDSALLQATGE